MSPSALNFDSTAELHDAAAEWFTFTSSAGVTLTATFASGEVATVDAGAVILQLAPVHPPLTDVGMAATMVVSPMFAGDTFTVTVVAHTGNLPGTCSRNGRLR